MDMSGECYTSAAVKYPNGYPCVAGMYGPGPDEEPGMLECVCDSTVNYTVYTADYCNAYVLSAST